MYVVNVAEEIETYQKLYVLLHLALFQQGVQCLDRLDGDIDVHSRRHCWVSAAVEPCEESGCVSAWLFVIYSLRK